MVDTLLTAAALCAATSLHTKAIHVPNDPPTSLKPGEHVRVQTERRRIARAAVTSASTLDSLRPMLERAKANSAMTEAKGLLETAERELENGQQEQAMLTLDGAALRLQQAARLAGTNDLKDVFQDLESKENTLREKLGQPAVLPFTPRNADEKNVREIDDVKKPVPPKRDELPVG